MKLLSPTNSEGHRSASIAALLLLPVEQHPLQQHLSQLLLPRMLRLDQSDGLGQRRPLTPDESRVQLIQEPLFGSTQFLRLLAGRGTHSPAAVEALSPAEQSAGEEPSVRAPRSVHWKSRLCGEG